MVKGMAVIHSKIHSFATATAMGTATAEVAVSTAMAWHGHI